MRRSEEPSTHCSATGHMDTAEPGCWSCKARPKMKKGAALGNGTLRACSMLRVAERPPSAASAKGHSNSQEARSSGASRVYLSTCINLSTLQRSRVPSRFGHWATSNRTQLARGGDPPTGRRPHIVPHVRIPVKPSASGNLKCRSISPLQRRLPGSGLSSPLGCLQRPSLLSFGRWGTGDM